MEDPLSARYKNRRPPLGVAFCFSGASRFRGQGTGQPRAFVRCDRWSIIDTCFQGVPHDR